MQLYRQHLQQGAATTVNPRQQLVYDFAEFLFTLTTHQLIVAMDANEATTDRDSTSLFDHMEELGLVSAYQVVTRDFTTLPPTHLRGSLCIDYIYHPYSLSLSSEHYHPPIWMRI